MPTILVADDNSNIQKMVALAFKDEGIDVVTVGNGEAAVRKAGEIMPDLVLADIFMPVRGGYEVCEFLKQNTRFAHIPVVLLAGAFDPFDEREAQRVGADGVLKKPFVPTDPLVNLVKGLLSKANPGQLVSVSAPAQSPPATEIKSGVAFQAAPPQPEKPAAPEFPAEFPQEMDEMPQLKDFSLGELGSDAEGGADPFAAMLAKHAEVEPEPLFKPSFEENLLKKQPLDDAEPEIDSISAWGSKAAALEQPSSESDVVDTLKSSASTISNVKDLPGRGWNIAPAVSAHPEEETLIEPLDRYVPLIRPGAIDEESENKSESLFSRPVPPVTAFSTGVEDEEAHDSSSAAATNSNPTEKLPASTDSDTSIKDWRPSFPVIPANGARTVGAPDEAPSSWRSYTPTAGSPMGGASEDSHESVLASASTTGTESNLSTQEQIAQPLESTPDPVDEVQAHSDSASAPVTNENEWADTSAETIESASRELPPAESLITQADSFPVPAPAPIDPKVVEDMVTRVVERMQPQILEVITREVLRPLVEALVRRQLEQK